MVGEDKQCWSLIKEETVIIGDTSALEIAECDIIRN
jgi:hypothetical protein